MKEYQPQGIESLEKEQSIEFVHGLLASIQSDVLISIFKKIFARSRVNFDETKFVFPNEVEVFWKETNQSGSYIDGHIALNAFHMVFDDEGKSRAQVLKSYIHELVHALASSKEEGGERKEGYQVNVDFYKEHADINEAMTELIQDQVFREYLKQSGDRTLLASNDGAVRKRLSYPTERQEVLQLVDRASVHFGIAKEDVLRALIAGYFAGATSDMVEFF